MSLGSWLGPLAGCVMLLAPSLARAQCTMDTECKGDRVCENGQCTAPVAAPSGAAAPASAAQAAAVLPASSVAPAAPPPLVDSQPRMVRHSKGMMVGGIVMTSLAPVALAVAGTAWLGEGLCNIGSDSESNDPSCDYDSVIYGALLTTAVLVGVGVPLIVIGAKKEPENAVATATVTPWATPRAVGLGIRISM